MNITALGEPYPNLACKNRQQQSTAPTTTSNLNEFDLSLLLKMALTKIPQIPFEFILDEFRWNLFSGNVSMDNANDYFWLLAFTEQGIHPPDWESRRDSFDPGAKYHVADNTPYVRYVHTIRLCDTHCQILLTHFLQILFGQLHAGTNFSWSLRSDRFRACQSDRRVTNAVTSLRHIRIKTSWQIVEVTQLNRTYTFTLYTIFQRIDAFLFISDRKALSIGAEQHWTESLYILTGSREVSADALLLYYKPLIGWLRKQVIDQQINIGW